MDKPNFPRWTIFNFVEQLAEGTPMPGGGCAVSVVGALASALGSLSGQISLKKESDTAQKDILRRCTAANGPGPGEISGFDRR